MEIRFVRTLAAAKYVGISKSMMEKLRITGGGPRFALLGSAVVYAVPDLESWVASRTVGLTSEGGNLPSISTDALSRQTTPPTVRRGRPPKVVSATVTG